MVIKSKRLILRPISFDDWAFILTLFNHNDFIQHIGDKQIKNKSDALRYIAEKPMAMQKKYGYSLMLITLSKGEKIGVCGLLKRDTLPLPDLGYALLPTYYRQGYAQEAAAAVLAYYKELSEILAVTGQCNKLSQQLLVRLGFIKFELPHNEAYEQNIVYKWIR